MSEHVTDEMVEQAAQAAQARKGHYLRVAPVGCTCGWKSGVHGEAEGMRLYEEHMARAVLDAVAPTIAARALEKAAEAYQLGGWAETPQADTDLASKRRQAEHAVRWLRTRAAKSIDRTITERTTT